MNKKIKINIEDVQKLIQRINEFEKLKFDNIEWYKNGEKCYLRKIVLMNGDLLD